MVGIFKRKRLNNRRKVWSLLEKLQKN
jgi:hypothetical protein